MTAPSPAAPSPRLNWPLVLVFWGLISAFLIARAVFTADGIPLIEDTDDAMRLVVVRDFLNGQNWFDHTQYRLNTPFGADIHWSRLVDLPIAALILLFRPLAGGFAETITAYVWPLSLLLILMWLSARLTLRLVGPAGLLPALALPVLSPAVSAEFSPGRFDHHGIQILLTLALVWCTVEALHRPRWAIGAGLAAATALAIGTEGLPAVAVAAVAFGVLWVLRPERANAMRGFGLSLAAGAAVHLAVALPPGRWLEPACDAISIVYVAGALAIGVAFTILPLVGVRSLPGRLVAGAAAGLTVIAVIALLFPSCLRGPYAALDPWLVSNWLNRIAESKPLLNSLRSTPDLTLGFAVPPILGILALVLRLWRGTREGRDGWLVLGAFLAVTVMVMAVQVRGSRIAMPLAVPAAAWLIAEMRARYLAAGGIGAIAGLVGSWLAFTGIAVLLVVNLAMLAFEQLSPAPTTASAKPATGSDRCLMPAAFADLAGLPPARIMTPVDLGSHVLLFTPHSVVAAPYHRNQAGVRDAFDFFNLPIAEARPILARRGVTLVVTCPGMTEMGGLPQAAPDSFVKLLAAGAVPDWLDDVSLPDAALRVFSVAPNQGPRPSSALSLRVSLALISRWASRR